MKNKKRICLFVAYDKNNYIHDYVIYYLQELSKFADIYYLAECEMNESELEKIKPHTIERYAYKHGKYDFGSWQELINKIGYEKLSKYDELILANDSCFAPIFPLENVFLKADAHKIDFWGITEGHRGYRHLQTYFIVFKRNVFQSEIFKDFINSIIPLDKENIIDKYEARLTHILVEAGFKCKKLLKGDIGPYQKYIDLLKLKSPFIKKITFTLKNEYKFHQSLVNYEKYFKKYSDYDISLIKKYLERENIPENYFKSKSYRKEVYKYNINAFLKWLFDFSFGKRKHIIKIFGVVLYEKYKNSIDNF